MQLEKVIKKLKGAKCNTQEERENININIKICEMQIKILNRFNKKDK